MAATDHGSEQLQTNQESSGGNIYTTVDFKMRIVCGSPCAKRLGHQVQATHRAVLRSELISRNRRANLLKWNEPLALQNIVELICFQVLNNVGRT